MQKAISLGGELLWERARSQNIILKMHLGQFSCFWLKQNPGIIHMC